MIIYFFFVVNKDTLSLNLLSKKFELLVQSLSQAKLIRACDSNLTANWAWQRCRSMTGWSNDSNIVSVEQF